LSNHSNSGVVAWHPNVRHPSVPMLKWRAPKWQHPNVLLCSARLVYLKLTLLQNMAYEMLEKFTRVYLSKQYKCDADH